MVVVFGCWHTDSRHLHTHGHPTNKAKTKRAQTRTRARTHRVVALRAGVARREDDEGVRVVVHELVHHHRVGGVAVAVVGLLGLVGGRVGGCMCWVGGWVGGGIMVGGWRVGIFGGMYVHTHIYTSIIASSAPVGGAPGHGHDARPGLVELLEQVAVQVACV